MANVVAISGAAGSLGPSVVRAFYETGASLALAGRTKDKLTALLDSLGVPAERRLASVADLSDAAAAQEWAAEVQRVFGRVDAVLHLVGGYASGSTLSQLRVEDWDQLQGMLVRPTLAVVRAFAEPLRAAQGRFICVTSLKAQAPTAKSALYAMSKAASDALVLALADELKGTGATANLIVTDSITENRARQIAAAAVFLCSDAAAAINGARIPVTGTTA